MKQGSPDDGTVSRMIWILMEGLKYLENLEVMQPKKIATRNWSIKTM